MKKFEDDGVPIDATLHIEAPKNGLRVPILAGKVPPIEVGDGVALVAMADPNFDENGNCINETMRQFLATRVRPN